MISIYSVFYSGSIHYYVSLMGSSTMHASYPWRERKEDILVLAAV